MFSVAVNAAGHLGIGNGVTGKSVTSSTVVSTGAWHTLLVHVLEGSTGHYSVRLDGVWLGQLSTTAPLAGNPVATLRIGDASANRVFDIAFDNIKVQGPA